MIKLLYPETVPGGEKKDDKPWHIFMFILAAIFLMVVPFVFCSHHDEHRDHGYVVDREFVPATYGKNNHPDEYIIYVANKFKLFEVQTTKELYDQTRPGDSVSSVKKLETK